MVAASAPPPTKATAAPMPDNSRPSENTTTCPDRAQITSEMIQASVLSQVVDTLLFVTIAFWGVFPIGALLVGQMLAKVTLSVILVPWLIYLFVALGRRLDGAPVA